MELSEILKEHANKEAKDQKRIEWIRARIEKLENEMNKLWGKNNTEKFLEELAREMIRRSGRDLEYETLGPFGLQTERSIWLFEKDAEHKVENIVASLRFTGYLGDRMYLQDVTKDTGRYAPGTLGELNGMNHPNEPLENFSMEDLMEIAFRK